MNPDAMAEIEQSDDLKQEQLSKPAKPRGDCTGCKFDYQLGTARKGEYKGQLVIRKHLSRTGPGECSGSQKPPKGTEQDQAAVSFTDPAPVPEPYVTATFDSLGSCGHEIMEGEEIRPDGNGGWLCGLCSDEGPAPDRPQHVYDNNHGGVYVHEGTQHTCMQDECRSAREVAQKLATDLPHDRTPETIAHIPNGHDFTDNSGATFRHGGEFADCTTAECVQFRNRLNPPPVDTPVQHQCEHGLYADIRNCPGHGTPTAVEKLATSARQAFPDHTPGQLADIVQLAQEIHVGTATPVAVAPGGVPVFVDPAPAQSAFVALAAPEVASVGTFADPAPAPADLPSVSGQPEPDRDQWGRYKILGAGYTRATTFAKLGSSTYALGEWNERMLIKGLVLRPDLLAMAHSLDVKRDKGTLNKIADDAQEYAGNKVAANIGTAYHTFTERLDAGLMTLDDVPAQWRTRCRQYIDALALHGLTTRPEWMERTTAVRADQVSAPVGVAGTLDRIFQEPDGTLVIGDLKTSSNIEYSWSEIAVQLALYAHGVNTHGLFDWNTKTWSGPAMDQKVRTDYAIVMHLPADGDGCVLYKVDLVKGWEFAQVSGLVQARQKAKNVAVEMVPPPRPAPVPQTVPAPVLAAAEGPAPVLVAAERPELRHARTIVYQCADPDGLSTLYQQAVDSGLFWEAELKEIQSACAARWAELNVPY